MIDRYSLLIISKYFKTSNDYINAMLINKKYEGLVDMFHFNPIPINYSSNKLFGNIETQHIYNKYDELIPNLFNYIVWYPSDIKTIDYFEKNYHIRPIFKQLHVDYSFYLSGNKREGDLLILSQYSTTNEDENLKVDFSGFVRIKKALFYESPVREMKLGKHIKSIPYYCFDSIHNLESLDLSNVTEIDQYNFNWCNELTSITFSKHLETMDINCFEFCSSLKNISISDNSKEFKFDVPYRLYQAMKNNGIKCTGNVWVVNENQEIPDDIDCKVIKVDDLFKQETVLFDSIQIIPSYLLMSDSRQNVRQIVLSPSVVSINRRAFYLMKSLEGINLENVKYLRYDCFMHCSKLKEVNITNARFIGENVFYGCSSLSSVTYSGHINYLSNNCFSHCPNLKEIKGIEGINRIGMKCFNKCNKLKLDGLPKNLIRIECLNGSRFKIKSIDKDCSILRFERGSFRGNTTLETIHISKTTPFKRIIREKAFSFCTRLKEVKLEGIRNLYDQAFKGCYSLSTIELPSSLKTIGGYCFENCWSLKEIQIPSNVHCIGPSAFENCKSLTNVEFENGKVNISSDIFNHCPLIEINLINGNKMKGCFSYDHYLGLKSKGIDVKKVEYTRSDRRKYGNGIPECCCRIGYRAFEGCSMKELTIPSNIKTLGYKCFNKCNCLNKIYMTPELKNNIKIQIFDNYRQGEDPFYATMHFFGRYYHLLFEKKLKEETIPIEIIEL